MYASEMIEVLQDLVERYGDVLVETKGRASDEVEVESPVVDVSMKPHPGARGDRLRRGVRDVDVREGARTACTLTSAGSRRVGFS